MFERTTDMIEKLLLDDGHANWVALVIALGYAWIILLVIREIWCWFWKTSKIARELESINRGIHALRGIGVECREELKRATTTLERVAEGVSAKAGDKQAGTGGS